MTEHTLEHAIAQVSKYKKLVKKARGLRKIVFKAHLAFWKEIRNSLREPQLQGDDAEKPELESDSENSESDVPCHMSSGI